MKLSRIKIIGAVALVAAAAVAGLATDSHADPPFAVPPPFGSHTLYVHCEYGETINGILPFVHKGDTLEVSGTCNENVLMSNTVGQFDGLTIDGQGSAVISGPSATANVIEIVGINTFNLQNITLTGGYDAFSINTCTRVGINNLTVQNAGRIGVHFQRASQGYIVNSNVSNNPSNGIVINENSYVRVGETDGVGATEGDTGPCTINNNGNYGVRIQRQSVARIYVSSIDNNVSDGIHVESESYAEIATDDISGNGGDGVDVSENGVVHLGNNSGTTAEDNPNTSTTPNTVFGIDASWGAYVQGRLGTLTGTSAATSFTHNAQDNLH